MQTEIVLPFADGSYLFALHLPQIAELQSKCTYTDRAGAKRELGILEIYGMVLAGQMANDDGQMFGLSHEGKASVQMLRETVRLGLIGGRTGTVNGQKVDVDAARALELTERYIDPAPIDEQWGYAAQILRAKVKGYDPKKKEEPRNRPARKTPNGSTTRKPSPPAP